MQQGSAARVIAACLGLAGFVVAIASGLAADNPASEILLSAIIALFICQLLGLLIGTTAEAVVRERIALAARARRGATSPKSSTDDQPGDEAPGEVLPS